MKSSEYAEQSEEFARDCFKQHGHFNSIISDADDTLLYELTVDLGNTLLDLARDPRLETLVGGAYSSPHGLDVRLAEILLVDWGHLLERFGYVPPPSAEDRANDVRASILRFSREPRPDTYFQLRRYLTDLGNRLVESDRPDSEGKMRRLRRRIGRGLWVLGRVSLAAAVGATVAALSASGVGVPTVAALAAGVGPEIAKAVIEQILPTRLNWSDADEDIELQERAGRLNDLLDFGRLGRLQANIELEHRAKTEGGLPSPPFSTDLLLWVSAVQGALLTMRSLTAASCDGLMWSCDKLAVILLDLRTAVREEAPIGELSTIFGDLMHVSQEVSRALAVNEYRPHRR